MDIGRFAIGYWTPPYRLIASSPPRPLASTNVGCVAGPPKNLLIFFGGALQELSKLSLKEFASSPIGGTPSHIQ